MAGNETREYAQAFDDEIELLDSVYYNAQRDITPKLFDEVATRIADVYRPSGTVDYQLGPAIERILIEHDTNPETLILDRDYRGTGNPVISVGKPNNGTTPHFFVAQGDEISGVIVRNGRGEAPFVPNYAHRQSPKVIGASSIESPGVVLRYSEDGGKPRLDVAARGLIATKYDGKRETTSFITEHGPDDELRIGDRVVYALNPRLTSKDGIYVGQLDNTLGVAAAVSAALSLGKHDYPGVEAYFVFDDYEERNPAGLIGSGARNLALANLRDPRLVRSMYTVSDGHDILPGRRDSGGFVTDDEIRAVDGALIPNIISDGQSISLSPQAQFRMQHLMDLVREHGGRVYFDGEKNVRTSRSSEMGLQYGGIQDEAIRVMGPGSVDFHYVQGRYPRGSVRSALETARFAAVMSVAGSRGLL